MRMQQLPLFNTAYADRDGHIAYVYNATLWKHATGDYRFWQGVVPGDRSDLIATEIVPYDEIPKVIDPPTGWVQNSNDMPWTSVVSDDARLDQVRRRLRRAAGHHAARAARHRILSTAPEKMTLREHQGVEAVDARRDRRSVRGRDRRHGEGHGHRAREARRRRAGDMGSRGGGGQRRHAALLQVHDRGGLGLRVDRRLQGAHRRQAAARDAARLQGSGQGHGRARHGGRRGGEGVRVARREVGRRAALPPRQRRLSRATARRRSSAPSARSASARSRTARPKPCRATRSTR